MLFIRLQAANDSADLNDLRNFTTPELFASLRLDLQDRGDAKQQTDVVKVDAKLIDFADEAERQIVSVRFTGVIREAPDAAAEGFDEGLAPGEAEGRQPQLGHRGHSAAMSL